MMKLSSDAMETIRALVVQALDEGFKADPEGSSPGGKGKPENEDTLLNILEVVDDHAARTPRAQRVYTIEERAAAGRRMDERNAGLDRFGSGNTGADRPPGRLYRGREVQHWEDPEGVR